MAINWAEIKPKVQAQIQSCESVAIGSEVYSEAQQMKKRWQELLREIESFQAARDRSVQVEALLRHKYLYFSGLSSNIDYANANGLGLELTTAQQFECVSREASEVIPAQSDYSYPSQRLERGPDFIRHVTAEEVRGVVKKYLLPAEAGVLLAGKQQNSAQELLIFTQKQFAFNPKYQERADAKRIRRELESLVKRESAISLYYDIRARDHEQIMVALLSRLNVQQLALAPQDIYTQPGFNKLDADSKPDADFARCVAQQLQGIEADWNELLPYIRKKPNGDSIEQAYLAAIEVLRGRAKACNEAISNTLADPNQVLTRCIAIVNKTLPSVQDLEFVGRDETKLALENLYTERQAQSETVQAQLRQLIQVVDPDRAAEESARSTLTSDDQQKRFRVVPDSSSNFAFQEGGEEQGMAESITVIALPLEDKLKARRADTDRLIKHLQEHITPLQLNSEQREYLENKLNPHHSDSHCDEAVKQARLRTLLQGEGLSQLDKMDRVAVAQFIGTLHKEVKVPTSAFGSFVYRFLLPGTGSANSEGERIFPTENSYLVEDYARIINNALGHEFDSDDRSYLVEKLGKCDGPVDDLVAQKGRKLRDKLRATLQHNSDFMRRTASPHTLTEAHKQEVRQQFSDLKDILKLQTKYNVETDGTKLFKKF